MSEIVGYLVGQVGEMSGMRVAIPAKGLVIGRDPKQADLVITHTLVSRKHAQVASGKDAKLYLIDLQSRNGTFVNGHRLSAPVPLQPNDKIEFGAEGKVVFLFESAETTSVSGVLKEAFGETVAPVEWKVGDTILGIYEVTGLLGQGGFGKVYKVHHKGWNLDLAVKSPLPELFADEKAVENFIREAETWVNLDLHPNVVQCHYVRTIGGIPRIFAEYVPGGTLHQWIAQKKLTTLDQILDVAIQFAWGLHAAHEKGLVHQDVKPLNVLMTPDGIAKVSDFGLARSKPVVTENITTGDGNLVTMAGSFTLAYCSPEQVVAAKQRAGGVPSEERVKLSRSTDIWSWAVSVLQMFTGQIIWQYGFQAGQVLEERQKFFGPNFLIKMPKQLAKLLGRCLRVHLEDRPKDMLEIATELLAIYEAESRQQYSRPEPKLTEHLADSLNNRALSLLDLGRTEQAEQTWQEALKVDPQHLESIYNLGLHQWRTARIDDWALALRLREAGPESAPWRKALLAAHVELESGDAEAAIQLLQSLAEPDRHHPEIETLMMQAQQALESSPRCLRTFEGDSDEGWSVCLSADGRYALWGSGDTALGLWELPSGRCLRTFEGHTDRVYSVRLSADGKYAVSATLPNSGYGKYTLWQCKDETLRLWELSSGRCLRIFDTSGFTSVCLSADGRYALLQSEDVTIDLWDLSSGRCLQTLIGYRSDRLYCLSADGRYAMWESLDDGTLDLWELSSGCCLQTFEGHSDTVFSVCLSADGRYALSTSGDRTLRLWELSSGRCLRTFEGHTDQVFSVCLSADGRYALSGSEDGTLRLWELSSGRCLRTFEGQTALVTSVCLTADGKYALSGSQNGTVRLWRLSSQISHIAPWMMCQVVPTAKLQEVTIQFEALVQLAKEALSKGQMPTAFNAIRQARALPGHRRVKEALNIWQNLYSRFPKRKFADGWLERTFENTPSVLLSADGRYALSNGRDRTLRLWELPSGRCLRTFEGHPAWLRSVCLSADGRYALSTSGDRTLRLWELSSGRCLRTFEGHTDQVFSVCLSADGRYALSTSGDRTLRLWELSSGRCLRTFEGHASGVKSVCLSSDGRYALSGNLDGTLGLWELSSGRCLRTFEGHTDAVGPVSLSADGRYALSVCQGYLALSVCQEYLYGSKDKTLRLWELSSGCCLRIFDTGDTRGFSAVCLSADGRYALSGSSDRTLRLWEVSSGCCLRTFDGHTDGVHSVCLTGDCWYAVSASYDNTIRLWTLDWELDPRPEADWDDGAEPYLRNFLVLHCPVGDDGLTRIGKPEWHEDDFKRLLYTLGCAGYGWLRPRGVRRELEKMVATWTEPPPLGVG